MWKETILAQDGESEDLQ